jgi:hypothetical protein
MWDTLYLDGALACIMTSGVPEGREIRVSPPRNRSEFHRIEFTIIKFDQDSEQSLSDVTRCLRVVRYCEGQSC